jgi:hypothetical protein
LYKEKFALSKIELSSKINPPWYFFLKIK